MKEKKKKRKAERVREREREERGNSATEIRSGRAFVGHTPSIILGQAKGWGYAPHLSPKPDVSESRHRWIDTCINDILSHPRALQPPSHRRTLRDRQQPHTQLQFPIPASVLISFYFIYFAPWVPARSCPLSSSLLRSRPRPQSLPRRLLPQLTALIPMTFVRRRAGPAAIGWGNALGRAAD